MAKRYDAIDGLRTYSAIGIVLMHVLANGDYGLNGFLFKSLIPSFTNLVFLFMIISGFSMCCGYYEKIVKNEISLGGFYRRRFEKVWPFFAALCVLDVIISPSFASICEAFANMTLCFGFIDAEISVIGVGWFLGVVFIFYLIFPFFCYLISDKRRAWFSFGVALMLNIVCKYYFNVSRSNFAYSAVYFLAGGLIYIYRDKIAELSEKFRWLILLVCMSFAAVYYLAGGYTFIMLMLFSALLVYALKVKRGGVLINPVTRYVSSISMEIYLCHMVIYRLAEKLHLLNLGSSKKLSYIYSSILVLIGAIIFSVVLRAMLTKTRNFCKKFF